MTFSLKGHRPPNPVYNAALKKTLEAIKSNEALDAHLKEHYGEDFKPLSHGINTHGIHEGQGLMEVCEHRINPSWGIEEWRKYLDTVGVNEFRTLMLDADRFHKCIYGAEYLRLHSTQHDRETWMGTPETKTVPVNPELDSYIPPTQWGGVDDAEDQSPIREQVVGKQESLVQNAKESVAPVALDLDGIRDLGNDPYLQRWKVAEEIARKPKTEWQGKLDFEMEQMVRYCYGWLRDTGNVPQPYPFDVLDLFWRRPVDGELIDADPRYNERMQKITERVVSFWRNSLKKAGTGIDLHSKSYRVTLAAMKLEKRLHKYAINYRNLTVDGLDPTDESLEKLVREAAVTYFQAHFPIRQAGPVDTLDPDYVGYVQLCRKYGLTEGELLHLTII